MKYVLRVLALAALLHPLAHAGQLGLHVGEVKYVKLTNTAERINVSKSGIAELFLPSPKTLSVKATESGISVLEIEYSDGSFERITITVAPEEGTSATVIKEYLKQALDTVPGLKYQVITTKDSQKKVLITGTADKRNESFVKQVTGLFPDSVENQATFADRSEEEIADYLKKSLQGRSLDFKIVDGKIQISGQLDSTDKDFYTRLIAPYSQDIDNQVSFYESEKSKEAKLAHAPTVQIDVEIIEVSRSDMSDIGVQWFPGSNPIEIDASSAGTASSQSVFNIGNMTYASQLNLTGLKLQLKALVDDGKARILATPRLKVSSGSQATFLAGGEVPIVSTTANASSVEYKKFGTQLDITPQVRDKEYVQVKVEATLSTLDFGQAVQGNPTIMTKKAQTELIVRDGESFALAGLVERQQSETESKIPLLGDIPILGRAFNNKSTQYKETETLIIMTPRIIRDHKAVKNEDTKDFPEAHSMRNAVTATRHLGFNRADPQILDQPKQTTVQPTQLQSAHEESEQMLDDLNKGVTRPRKYQR